MKSFKLISSLLTMLICFTTAAQERSITGTVSDDSGIIQGVSISIKKSRKTVHTDYEGKYVINVQNEDTLIFSFVGFEIQSKTVENKNVIDVKLIASPSLPEGLGYTEIRKRPTAAITQVTQEQISGAPITETNKHYSSGTKIAVVCVPSISNAFKNEPIYVLDGVLIKSQELAKINPSDIDNITVLKDSAATSLYGKEAYYGAIIITTKNKIYENLTLEEIDALLNKKASVAPKESKN